MSDITVSRKRYKIGSIRYYIEFRAKRLKQQRNINGPHCLLLS